MSDEIYPLQKQLTCIICDGTSFQFVWSIESKDHEMSLIYCHDGFGFQFEDATQKCTKCGNTSTFEIRTITKNKDGAK